MAGSSEEMSPQEKFEKLRQVHEQKVKALMKSIHVLKGQLTIANASAKDHRRSALIRQLRDAVKDHESVVDVLRQALMDRGMTAGQVDQIIINQSCQGPKRFRPKTREELQQEVESLTKRNASLESQIRKLRKRPMLSLPQVPETNSSPEERSPPPPLLQAPTSTLGSLVSPRKAAFDMDPEDDPSRKLKEQVDRLSEELMVAQAGMASSERVVCEQDHEIRRLRGLEEEHLDTVEQFEEAKHRCRSLKQDLRDERERRKREEKRAVECETRMLAMEDELRLKDQQTEIEAGALRDEFNVRMTDLRDALVREQKLQAELEALRLTVASERTAHRHALHEQTRRCGELEGQRKQLEDRFDALQQVSDRLATQVDRVQEDVAGSESVKHRLRTVSEKQREASVRASDLAVKLDLERDHRVRLETTLQQQAELFTALQREAEQLKREHNEALSECQAMRERVRALSETQQSLALRERELGSKYESQVAQRAEAEARLRVSEEALDTAMSESHHIKSELERSFDKSQLEIEQLRQDLEQCRRDRRTLEEESRSRGQEREGLVRSHEQRVRSLEATIAELRSNSSTQSHRVQELERALEQAVRTETSLRQSIEQLSMDVQAAQQDDEANDGLVSELESCQQARAQLEGEKAELLRRIGDLNEHVTSLNSEVSRLTSESAEGSLEARSLRDTIQEQARQLDELRRQQRQQAMDLSVSHSPTSRESYRPPLSRESTEGLLGLDIQNDEFLRDAIELKQRSLEAENDASRSRDGLSSSVRSQSRDRSSVGSHPVAELHTPTSFRSPKNESFNRSSNSIREELEDEQASESQTDLHDGLSSDQQSGEKEGSSPVTSNKEETV